MLMHKRGRKWSEGWVGWGGDRGKLFFRGLRLLFVRDSLPLVWLAGEEDVSLETASVIKGVQKKEKGCGVGLLSGWKIHRLKFFYGF